MIADRKHNVTVPEKIWNSTYLLVTFLSKYPVSCNAHL